MRRYWVKCIAILSPMHDLVFQGHSLDSTARSATVQKMRTIAPILSLLVLLYAPPPLRAQLLFTNVNGAITITGSAGPASAITIPAQIGNLPVTGIADFAFQGDTNLQSVAIADSVTNIGQYAFYLCSSLTNCELPAGVVSLPLHVFSSCTSLAAMTIPAGVSNIGAYAFSACSALAGIAIPAGVTNIGQDAFAECGSLTNAAIPGTVAAIGDQAFMDCSSLASIIIPNGVVSLGDYSFAGCAGLANASIAGTVDYIGLFAFNDCAALTNLVISPGVVGIGESAFADCTSLVNVTIPASVLGFDENAFFGCTALASVVFLGNPPSADGSVFFYDSNTTAYYMPGTTGWSSPFGGRPAVLWNPMIQNDAASFGATGDKFGFNIVGAAGLPVVVQAQSDLAGSAWVPLQSLTLTNGSAHFDDPHCAGYSRRFYRLTPP